MLINSIVTSHSYFIAKPCIFIKKYKFNFQLEVQTEIQQDFFYIAISDTYI